MKKKINEKRLAIKMIMCLVYLIGITILSVCSYRLYEQKKNIVSWSDVENVEDYTYMKISRMSEKFAYYESENVGIHFIKFHAFSAVFPTLHLTESHVRLKCPFFL